MGCGGAMMGMAALEVSWSFGRWNGRWGGIESYMEVVTTVKQGDAVKQVSKFLVLR
jgi:hypothetical protein